VFKWIVGLTAAMVVHFAAAVFVGYRKYKEFTAAGNAATVAIAASPERVFASLATADSLSTWMGTRMSITTSRPGTLEAGDTLRIIERDSTGRRSVGLTWTVTEVRNNQLVAVAIKSDTSEQVLFTRRDSLVPMGDSTMVISSVASPLFDQFRKTHNDSAQPGGAIVDFGSNLAVAAMRHQSELELKRLKSRIEGTAPPPPPTP
jgi:uncharacterized protein YndB with AHSA1/START domain